MPKNLLKENKKKASVRRKLHKEKDDIQFQTINELDHPDLYPESRKFSKERIKSKEKLRNTTNNTPIINDESKLLKTVRPPKSPSVHNYLLPCQMKKKGKILKKEKLIHNFHFNLQKTLTKNSSKGALVAKSQSGLEMQLDLLKKIHLRKE